MSMFPRSYKPLALSYSILKPSTFVISGDATPGIHMGTTRLETALSKYLPKLTVVKTLQFENFNLQKFETYFVDVEKVIGILYQVEEAVFDGTFSMGYLVRILSCLSENAEQLKTLTIKGFSIQNVSDQQPEHLIHILKKFDLVNNLELVGSKRMQGFLSTRFRRDLFKYVEGRASSKSTALGIDVAFGVLPFLIKTSRPLHQLTQLQGFSGNDIKLNHTIRLLVSLRNGSCNQFAKKVKLNLNLDYTGKRQVIFYLLARALVEGAVNNIDFYVYEAIDQCRPHANLLLNCLAKGEGLPEESVITICLARKQKLKGADYFFIQTLSTNHALLYKELQMKICSRLYRTSKVKRKMCFSKWYHWSGECFTLACKESAIKSHQRRGTSALWDVNYQL
eukprot:snap_masked-scaffold_11-processed-gene-8.21-mRNA-1 protein AED:1.00 eAED:1.00 QI:0/-1/0/0/-1/1/1/0/393